MINEWKWWFRSLAHELLNEKPNWGIEWYDWMKLVNELIGIMIRILDDEID